MDQKNKGQNEGDKQMEKRILLNIAEILLKEHLLTAEEQILFNQMLQKA